MARKAKVKVALTLRLWEVSDAAAHFALVDRERQRLRMELTWVDKIETVEDSRRFLTRVVQDYEDRRAVRCGIFRGDELVGAVNVVVVEPNRIAELGIWSTLAAREDKALDPVAQKVVEFSRHRLAVKLLQFRPRLRDLWGHLFAQRLGFTFRGTELSDEPDKEGRFFSLDRFERHLPPLF